ncbi:uncharacterized protein KRP23_14432 [Phytophthora ramorum]|uniref:uncharacterized protein n=1 Tax=Phytophthora ramorum TaxID=164328 RepID=UPI0030AA82E5|nr:hypothetical protein KRP23_14432 [Phytophthora ramorum]
MWAVAAKSQLPICVVETKTDKKQQQQQQPPLEAMLYKPHTPMELGDAVLGQLTGALVFVFDHMIPAVHNVVSWETDDIDLGPIVPEWAEGTRPVNTSKVLTTQPHALTA